MTGVGNAAVVYKKVIFAGMVALFLVSMVVLSYLGGPTAEKKDK